MLRRKSWFSRRQHFGMKRSREKDLSLRFKGMLQKTVVRHSTPEVESTHSKKLSSLGSLLNFSASLSPRPNKSLESAPNFEERPPHPKGWHSWNMRKLSIMTDPSEESSNSSQFISPRRRLSTIIGSEESGEALYQTAIPTMSPDKRTSYSRASYSKSKEATIQQRSKCHEMALKESTPKRKRKRNLDKKLVEKRVREWELRQLKNIEEATIHELTIED